MADKNPRENLKTSPPVRGSYVNLLKARGVMGSEKGDTPRLYYSMVLMLDKENEAHMAYLAHVKETAMRVATDLHGGKVPPKKFDWPWEDGDDFEDKPEYKGHVIVRASALKGGPRNVDMKPKVLDRDLQEVIDPNQVQSGFWFRVAGNIYGWEYQGKKGVSFGLQNVQVWEEDEVFGGGSRDAEADFSEDDTWGD